MEYLDNIGLLSKNASIKLNKLTEQKLNECLIKIADSLINNSAELIFANSIDVKNAKVKGVTSALIDRLRLTEKRIVDMADGLKQIALLKSPVGQVIFSYVKENGLKIEEKRVPFGVIGIIFESRPNVTCDAFGLCFKTANAVILRGGSDAINSNLAIVKVIQNCLTENGIDKNSIQLIENTDRSVATEFMKLKKYVDLLIPRGGAGLIRSVVENSTIPVIETGTGNCHIYVDETANFDKAVEIIYNAKTQRYGVCNACESLVINRKIEKEFLPLLKKKLKEKQVEIRADEPARDVCSEFVPVTEEDYGTEYLSAIISIKTVDNIDEAIEHINKYNTGHSEAIITENQENAERFLNEIDASTVYVNASTRFTDGFEFGFGAEIGISTQKLHARGPMGLNALTTTKFLCRGNGQIRK